MRRRPWGPHLDDGHEDEIARGRLAEIVEIFTNQWSQKRLHFGGLQSHRLELWRFFLLPAVHDGAPSVWTANDDAKNKTNI